MKLITCILICILLLSGCTSTIHDLEYTTLPEESVIIQSPTETAAAPLLPETTCPETEPVCMPTEPAVTVFDPYSILETMTLEEKVGQLFLAACPETGAMEDIENYHLGGYILFGKDFEGQTPESVIQTISAYQDRAVIPLLIAVDEEGGTVCRVSSNKAFRNTRFSSPRTLYRKGAMELVISGEEEKCQLLSNLGINVNMGPVCDVTTDPSAFMYKRSLGESPMVTGQFVESTVQIMSEYSIGSVLKHFPGYGNNTDTHIGIAVDRRKLQSLETFDLVPFAMGIQAGCDAILVSHTIVECLDTKTPASLSPAVHKYLRREMGFEGVIVTDDLTMDAITDQYGSGEAAVLAVLAGNDLLCTFDYRVQYDAVLSAVEDGRISMEMLDLAVSRVLSWKHELNLM